MPVRRLLIASPRPVPPYLRVGGRIRLAEGLEQAPHPVGRDADAGIAHGEYVEFPAVCPWDGVRCTS